MRPWQVLVIFAICAMFSMAGRTIGRQKGRQTLGEVLGFFLWLIGLAIIALLPPTEEGLVRQEQQRVRVQEEAQRRLEAERQWPNGNPWDASKASNADSPEI